MTVQELIDTLEGFDHDAEVKLAIQPSWPFQHSISEVVQGIDGSCVAPQWGVIKTLDDGDEEIEECQSRWEADQRVSECGRMPHVVAARVGALFDGEIVDRDEATELEECIDKVVYLADGGQDCYLPGDVASTLGWK